LQRTEAALKAQYEKATQKYRNTQEFEEALWALADSTADRRQIAEVYDSSYKWIVGKRPERDLLPREKLNQRYLSLRKETHGRIVVGHGAGWFSFREAIMRGYVRLKAEDNGIDLGRHSKHRWHAVAQLRTTQISSTSAIPPIAARKRTSREVRVGPNFGHGKPRTGNRPIRGLELEERGVQRTGLSVFSIR